MRFKEGGGGMSPLDHVGAQILFVAFFCQT